MSTAPTSQAPSVGSAGAPAAPPPQGPLPFPLPDVPPLTLRQVLGALVRAGLHCFDIRVHTPMPAAGIRAANSVGGRAAQLSFRWRAIPADLYAEPGLEPPPTVFDPARPQRFVMLDSKLRFDDDEHSGFRGFGTGLTFPLGEKLPVRLGAIGVVLEGFGKLKGLQGMYVFNGHMTPSSFCFDVLIRLSDPEQEVLSTAGFPPVLPLIDPDPATTFVCFHGEPDPERPQSFNFGPGGQITGSNVNEILRIVSLNFASEGSRGLHTGVNIGPVIGRAHSVTLFNPLIAPGTAMSPIPYETRNTLFTFLDSQGATIGTLKADTTEGRALVTPIKGVPPSVPSFRFAGFGRFQEGIGQFAGAQGMLSVTSMGSLGAFVVSNLYMLRISDPDRKFRATIGG